MDIDIVDKALIFVAKRNSGKSILMKYIISLFKHKFAEMFCICPSECVNHFYQKDNLIEKNNIFDHYHEDWCEKLISKMSKVNEGKDKNSNKFVRILLILDDCCSDVNFHQSKSLKKLMTRGRHIGITVMISAQYPYHIPPVCRINADYVFSGQLNKQGLDTMCEEFLNCGLTKEEFIKMYKDSTIDYSFLIINNNSVKSADPNEVYGRIKVPENFV